MPLDQLLLTLLGVAILANVLLVVMVPLRARRQRRSFRRRDVPPDRGPHAPAEPGPNAPAEPGPPGPSTTSVAPRDDDDARAAAAIEEFVASVSADAAGRARPPAPSELISRTREAVPRAPLPRSPERPFHAQEYIPAGLADEATWDRTVREESVRVARFGRPATVVMAELPHLDEVADRLGRDVADRVISETTRVFVSQGRAVDRIALLGEARFGVLLLETDEIAARGYIDRLRAAADGWLESAGLSTRLCLGWASPADGGDVATAAATARQRMHDDHPSPARQ